MMPLLDDLLQVRKQQVEFATRRFLGLIDQRGMAGHLPEAKQRLEDVHPRLLDSFAVNPIQHGLAVEPT